MGIGVWYGYRGMACRIGVSMTLETWLVVTQNKGVMDPILGHDHPFLKGHGDSR